MKILFYLYRFHGLGGIENVTAFLANAFVHRSHEATIIYHVTGKGQEDAQRVDNRVSELRMPDTQFCTSRNRKFLQSQILRMHPDFVVFQDSYAPIETNLFPLEWNSRVIIVEHNAPYQMRGKYDNVTGAIEKFRQVMFAPLHSYRYYKREIIRRKYLYDKCWRYCMLSDRFFGEFRAMTGLQDSRKLVAINNAVTLSPVNAENKINEVLFVGTLSERKGADVLFDIWMSLGKFTKDWQLTYIGDGPLKYVLEEKIARSNIENVKIVGYKRDPSPYFQRAKVFAFPSKREGWALVLTEAMINGCVPIAFDSYSAVRDIIVDEVNGFLIPPFDIEKFAVSLKLMLQEGDQREEMARAGKQSMSKFSPERIVGEWEKLFTLQK